MVQVFLLAMALAADAAAVTAGLATSAGSRGVVLKAALVFGGFQAGMAALGALGGTGLAGVLGPWLDVVAFVVLAFLGGRMLLGADAEEPPESVGWAALTTLGVATSIDALAAGVTLPVFPVPLALSVTLIGVVTAVLAGLAGLGGRALGERFGVVAQQVGGAVLILIGLAALVSAV